MPTAVVSPAAVAAPRPASPTTWSGQPLLQASVQFADTQHPTDIVVRGGQQVADSHTVMYPASPGSTVRVGYAELAPRSRVFRPAGTSLDGAITAARDLARRPVTVQIGDRNEQRNLGQAQAVLQAADGAYWVTGLRVDGPAQDQGNFPIRRASMSGSGVEQGDYVHLGERAAAAAGTVAPWSDIAAEGIDHVAFTPLDASVKAVVGVDQVIRSGDSD